MLCDFIIINLQCSSARAIPAANQNQVEVGQMKFSRVSFYSFTRSSSVSSPLNFYQEFVLNLIDNLNSSSSENSYKHVFFLDFSQDFFPGILYGNSFRSFFSGFFWQLIWKFYRQSFRKELRDFFDIHLKIPLSFLRNLSNNECELIHEFQQFL